MSSFNYSGDMVLTSSGMPGQYGAGNLRLAGMVPNSRTH